MLTKKKRLKRSKIWLLPEDEFIQLILKSKSIKDALDYFGLQNKGGNFRTIKKRISELNIDISHFLNNVDASNLTRTLSKDEFKKTWLTENSTKNRYHLKNYLTKFNLLDYKCNKCNNMGMWMNTKITLQLEHINGISNDNRLENLCFLCPNCHSQTSSYAGRNNKKTTITP
jgi:Zn finger protein HypA/HybF involved in hydrogenase expression